jgi:hypothetical protein
MNKGYLLLPFIASISLNSSAFADPLVALPASSIACSVDLTASASPSGAPPAPTGRIKHIEITRDGDLQRDIVTWSDGSSSETWRIFDVRLLVADNKASANSVNVYALDSSQAAGFTPRILALNLRSFSWISPGRLVGKENKDGKEVFRYRAPVLVPGFLPRDPPRQVIYQAWIDAKTLIPVALDDSDDTYKLAFSAPPTEPLILPERFKKIVDYYTRANAVAGHL